MNFEEVEKLGHEPAGAISSYRPEGHITKIKEPCVTNDDIESERHDHIDQRFVDRSWWHPAIDRVVDSDWQPFPVEQELVDEIKECTSNRVADDPFSI